MTENDQEPPATPDETPQPGQPAQPEYAPASEPEQAAELPEQAPQPVPAPGPDYQPTAALPPLVPGTAPGFGEYSTQQFPPPPPPAAPGYPAFGPPAGPPPGFPPPGFPPPPMPGYPPAPYMLPLEPEPEPKQPRAPRTFGTKTVVAGAIVAGLIGGAVGAATYAIADNNSGNGGLIFNGTSAPAAHVDGSISDAAAKIGPSVVTINISTSQEQATGSGVVIRAEGYVLTNNHVVSGASGNGDISVVLTDGERKSATIVGTDPSDDLAVIKIDATGLDAASFASSADLQVGQTVVAVGAPLGLSDTVTAGIVSNTARPVTTGDSANNQAIFNAVQTDAAINPGNSGGPLVNLNGAVIGINSAIATDAALGGSTTGNIGIGFAIPSDEASRIAAELIENGKATHAYLGVSVSDQQSTSTDVPVGAVIKDVTAGSPADKAGLKPGDVVTELGGQRIDSSNALVAAVRSHAPNSTVSLTYVRDGKSTTINVTLGSQDS